MFSVQKKRRWWIVLTDKSVQKFYLHPRCKSEFLFLTKPEHTASSILTCAIEWSCTVVSTTKPQHHSKLFFFVWSWVSSISILNKNYLIRLGILDTQYADNISLIFLKNYLETVGTISQVWWLHCKYEKKTSFLTTFHVKIILLLVTTVIDGFGVLRKTSACDSFPLTPLYIAHMVTELAFI